MYRPAPTVEDLSLTAEGMVRSANLKGYLQALARAYNSVYHTQEHADFWGLREFYSTVRAINRSLLLAKETSGDGSSSGVGGGGSNSIVAATTALDGNMLLNAILRNFGGRPMEIIKVVKLFFKELGLIQPKEYSSTSSEFKIESLIAHNLKEPSARHLMLLTKSNAALGILFDHETLKHSKTEVIFGSDFPLDQSDLQVCVDIQRIKLCMAEGITVVLVHCESLYESLYDLLNQVRE